LVVELVRTLPDWISITIVDNGSEFSGPNVEPILDRVDVIHTSKNGGFAAGVNAGLANVSSDSWLLLLNPDALITESALLTLLSEARIRKLDIASPRILRADSATPWFEGGYVDPRCGVIRQPGWSEIPNQESWCPFISGCVMLFSPNAVSRYLPLHEEYFMYWEDVDICLRAHQDGAKLGVVTRTVAQHDEGRSSSSGPGKSGLYYYYMSRNRVWVMRSHRDYFMNTSYPYTLVVTAKACREVARSEIHPIGKTLAVLAGTVVGLMGRRRFSWLSEMNPWR
jgi:hypothetical protein